MRHYRGGVAQQKVLTGWYKRYCALNIEVDFLLRAILAGDTDEAVKLGLLETEPKDFALCSFICPSKVNVCGIIEAGLRMVEDEGL